MKSPEFEIVKFSNDHRESILSIWEKSVLATHHFLAPEVFYSIKEMVKDIDFNVFEVFCLKAENELAGFIGVADQKVEMLFLSPDHIGKGYGKALMTFAMTQLKADKVDVNEQNTEAVGFYKKLGFEVYERTEKDDQGKNYPLLRMKLKQKSI